MSAPPNKALLGTAVGAILSSAKNWATPSSSHASSRLLEVLPGVWATRPEPLFGGSCHAHAFWVGEPDPSPQTPKPVWIYASSYVSDYLPHIEELGGVARQLLTHRDEASAACNVLASVAPVFCHETEKAAIETKGATVQETYTGDRHNFGDSSSDDSLVAFHAPGHTPGVTIYLYKGSHGTKVLFTGDTLYGSSSNKLATAPLGIHPYTNNRADMINTLALVRRLQPDYILPGLTSPGSQLVFAYKDKEMEQLEKQLSN